MHCPICGQQQVSDQTRFCSRCGFPLTGISEVVANNGIVPAQSSGFAGRTDSPRRRGIKQGAFLILLLLLVVPLLALLTLALDIEPYPPVIGALLFGVGGILRISYALMFESGVAATENLPLQSAMPGIENRGALPASQSIPVSAYTSPAAGSWRDTNDLQPHRGSVTDSTTKLLEKEDER